MAIGESLGSLVGGIVTLTGAAGEGGDADARRALSIIEQLRQPGFDFRDLTAPQLEFISRVSPELYEAIVPDEVRLGEAGPTRASQLRALAGLERYATEGQPAMDRLQRGIAVDALAQERGRATDAVLQDLGARGRLGGGTEVEARMAGGRAGAAEVGELGRALAADAINRRYGSALDAAALAGDVRSQDEALSQRRADTINAFNRYVSDAYTQRNRYAAEQGNLFSLRNAEERQRISEANRLYPYEVARDNLERRNRLADALSRWEFMRGQALAGQYHEQARRRDAERTERIRASQSIGEGVGGFGDAALLGSGGV